jgi:predicted RNase H-like HicB family nuclease
LASWLHRDAGDYSGGVAPRVTPNCRSVADLAYRVILEPEPDGSAYNAIIPAFPHAHTFGTTIEEAMANAREIVELELDLARERDEEIPVSDAEHVVIGTISVPAA